MEEITQNFIDEWQELSDELPAYQELDQEFFITRSLIERQSLPDGLESFVRGVIVDRFDSWIGFLHGIVMPSQGNMMQYEEANIFTEDEKHEVFTIMKRLMAYGRRSVCIALDDAVEDNVEFIVQALPFWKSIKQEIMPVAEKVRDFWQE